MYLLNRCRTASYVCTSARSTPCVLGWDSSPANKVFCASCGQGRIIAVYIRLRVKGICHTATLHRVGASSRRHSVSSNDRYGLLLPATVIDEYRPFSVSHRQAAKVGVCACRGDIENVAVWGNWRHGIPVADTVAKHTAFAHIRNHLEQDRLQGCSRDVIRVILVDSSLYRCFKVCVVCHIYSSSFVFGISIVIVSPIAKDWLNALLKLGNCWS